MRRHENQDIPFEYDTHQFRSMIIDETPFFIVKDVCNALGLTDTNKAVRKLEDDEKLTRKIFVSGQNRMTVLVNESGLYRLIFRSNKPNAKKFQKWVFNEVLPMLRKTGTYSTTDTPPPPSEPTAQLQLPFQKEELVTDAYLEQVKQEMLKVALSAKGQSRIAKFLRLITPLVYGEKPKSLTTKNT